MARSKGSKNIEIVQEVEAPRCPNCKSTRCEVLATRAQEDYAGTTGDGQPYNRIVRRNVRCADCGQVRIDRSLEFDPQLQNA